jgi:hypothetical protein
MIDELLVDPKTRAKYKKAAKYSKFDYAMKRITETKATVYRKDAKRTVNGTANSAAYQKLLQQTRHNEVMREFNKELIVQNDAYLSFRIRGYDKTPLTEYTTPDRFWAISHPDDSSWWVGIILDQKRDGAKESAQRYLIWTDTEVVKLDSCRRFISAEPHDFERIPGLLCHMRPVQAALLDPFTNNDTVDATLAALFEQTLMLKESKSVTAQLLLSGDLSTTASGQAQDTEVDVITGEGVGAQRVERGVGLEQFQGAGDYITERNAAGHGIGPDLLRHSGATSGYEMDLRRIPLEEQRSQQITVFRPIERELSQLQELIISKEAPQEPYAFSADGWRIDFAEVTRHMTDMEKYELRRERRRSGHSNVFAEALEDNPDMTPKAAKQFVMENQLAQSAFITMQRALNLSPDADAENPGKSPEENGADNQPPEEDEAEVVLQ